MPAVQPCNLLIVYITASFFRHPCQICRQPSQECSTMDYTLSELQKKGTSLVTSAATEIENLIRDRALVPGDKIPTEFELADTLNVGRGTVREAVKLLVSRNILEIRRGRGTFVHENPGFITHSWGLMVDEDETQFILSVLELRHIFEPELAAMAAERATDEEIAQIRDAAQKVEEDIREHRPHTENDVAFHLAIAAATHNQVARSILQQICYQGISSSVNATGNKLLAETVETHAQVLAGIEKHDASAAREGMRRHLSYNEELILKEKK